MAPSIGLVPSECMWYGINVFFKLFSLRTIKPIPWIWQKVSQVQASDSDCKKISEVVSSE
jgi:hypothetical protein